MIRSKLISDLCTLFLRATRESNEFTFSALYTERLLFDFARDFKKNFCQQKKNLKKSIVKGKEEKEKCERKDLIKSLETLTTFSLPSSFSLSIFKYTQV
jgi:hypothetical protein